jgi:hypothetical protein
VFFYASDPQHVTDELASRCSVAFLRKCCSGKRRQKTFQRIAPSSPVLRRTEGDIDPEQLRGLADTLTGDAASIVRHAAMEIELLRRHLFDARTGNADSERLDWLSQQAHDQYCEPAHRAYFTLPRILARKDGVAATTLRDAIDLVRKPPDQDF